MMTHRMDEHISRIRAKGSQIVMGLDTRIEHIPERHRAGSAVESILAYGLALIEACADIVPAVKIQAACYEMLGIDGMECMAKIAEEASRAGLSVILDAKRNDIGSTAEAYATAFLSDDAPFRADFLTVNPYFGTDGVKPFIDACERTGRGLFLLVRTSNPSSSEFQDIITDDGRALYERVGERVKGWGSGLIGREGYSSIGAVVGATHPTQGARLRSQMDGVFFLVPGYGAQGGTADDLRGCFDGSGGGAIVNASRSILCAWRRTGGDDFAAAARTEAIRMRDDIRAALKDH